MRWACSMYGERRGVYWGFSEEACEKETAWETLIKMGE